MDVGYRAEPLSSHRLKLQVHPGKPDVRLQGSCEQYVDHELHDHHRRCSRCSFQTENLNSRTLGLAGNLLSLGLRRRSTARFGVATDVQL